MHEGALAIQDPRVALTVESLARFGRARIGVTGSSMLPAIWGGDVIDIEDRPLDRVRVADIAVFLRNGRLFVHRVVEHLGTSLVTRGDTVPTADAPDDAPEFLGVVTRVARAGGASEAPFRSSIRQRLLARMVRHSHVAARVIERAHALLAASSETSAAS
jgi:hypothetical protein